MRHWTIPEPPVVGKVCAVCDQPCDFWFGSIYDDGEDNQCNTCCNAEIEQADQAYLEALQTDSDHPKGEGKAKEAYLIAKGKGKGKDKGAGGKDKGAHSRSRSPQRFDGDTAGGLGD
jgi:hypothetical protein